jgi:hypothetical protein
VRCWSRIEVSIVRLIRLVGRKYFVLDICFICNEVLFCIASSSSTVVPLLCQFVEGWLLQVGPDSVFKVNEALWDIEVAVQVEQFCEEESLAGSHPRQDNVNPISTICSPTR